MTCQKTLSHANGMQINNKPAIADWTEYLAPNDDDEEFEVWL